MERQYSSRNAIPPSRRRPPQRRRRKSGPPPILYLGAALIVVIILVIVLMIVLFSKGDSTKTPETSSTVSTTSQTSSLASEGTSSVSSAAPSSSEATPPPEKDVTGLPVEKLDSMLRVGDSGYEYYSFVEDTANKYITMVAKAGEELKGSATLYDMVIPTSMDILLPEDFLQSIETSDQKKAIDYIYGSINKMNPDVKTVSIFDTLKMHNNEYIYFRTDHHWTQLGAYYAYEQLMKDMGKTPVPLSDFEKKEYDGFLGSFYSSDSALAENPDTVEAYIPKADVTLNITQQDGTPLNDWALIEDGDAYDAGNKYLIFVGGDQPYEEITNNDLTDGSSCVVVKESFGNALIPFLVNHYQNIYVVDYRYYEGNIADLAKEKGAKDVIMLNNISMTRNADLVDAISNKF